MYGEKNCEFNFAGNPPSLYPLYSHHFSHFIENLKSSALVFSFFFFLQILTSVLQGTLVTSMLCVPTPKDRTIALVRRDIMETDEIAQASF